MSTVLVTGAGGFVGGVVVESFVNAGWTVLGAYRSEKNTGVPGVKSLILGDLQTVMWATTLRNVDVVVHLAARAHRMNDEDRAGYWSDNVDVTTRLAEACVQEGISRLVFLSSVKAMGEWTPPERPWNEDSQCMPLDAYGKSKLAAEGELRRLSARSTRMTVIRAPLVYGPGVKANFGRLVRLVDSGLPLPLGSIRNLRSFLFVKNLADAILAASRESAASGTFLLSDGEDLSTPDLVRRIARARGRRARLLSVPPRCLGLAGRVLGREDDVRRLTASLRVESAKIRRELSWKPPYSVDQGLVETFGGVVA